MCPVGYGTSIESPIAFKKMETYSFSIHILFLFYLYFFFLLISLGKLVEHGQG